MFFQLNVSKIIRTSVFWSHMFKFVDPFALFDPFEHFLTTAIVLSSCTFEVFEIDDWTCVQGGLYTFIIYYILLSKKCQLLKEKFL